MFESPWIRNTFVHRVVLKLAAALVLPLCVAGGAAKAWAQRHADVAAPAMAADDLPQQWEGHALRPLALSDVEQRFARRFPGSLARMTDGRQVLILRSVQRPTRMLHPAADCYRALGYRIAAQRLRLDAQRQLWRCFEATGSGRRLQVCERIVAADGGAFVDASAWYWAAVMDQSHGPWQAITVASPL